MKSVKPIHYALEFEPNFRSFTFCGKEDVEIFCKSKMREIRLNASELKIKNCYALFNGKKLKAKTFLDEKNEELKVTSNQKFSGKVILHFDFIGTLNNRLLGFYRSQYKHNGKTKYIATTQFEAADARRAFPCWDEPEAKATFDISIISENNKTAISNMPIVSKKKLGKKTLYKFATTPIMSTYLLYLGVGEFEHLQSKVGNIKVRVFTTKGNKSKGAYALNLAKKLLHSYENYFGIRYPLPKLDLIAIPDFAAGAMENWGAITFRETILLYDPKTSSTRTKQHIAEVISHELAHQWFGNLVTMKWWNDLWLNESFATYMATKFVDKFYPEWELWDQFLEDAMNTAMGTDALKSSHPIDVKVRNPSQIREIFDPISYDKGGCVLRMLENFVGKKNFREGLKHYLVKHKFDNATGEDLWKSIGKVSKKPVRALMKTWIKQVGFPLVELEQTDSKFTIYQKRFLMESKGVQAKQIWHIPLTISEQKISKLLTKRKESIAKPNDSAFIVNSGRHGFYRVRYDNSILLQLKDLISSKTVSHIDRWAIQNDLFALCIAGIEKIAQYLEFSNAYHNEDNYLTSVNVGNNLNFLYLHTFWEKFSDEIKAHVIEYFRELFSKLGWDKRKDDKHTDLLLRSFALFALGKMEEKEILEESKIRFESFLKNPKTLDPDISETVFSLAAWQGDEKTHNRLLSLYKKAKSQEEKNRFLAALCNFKDEKLLLKTLNFSQSKEVRSQNMHLSVMKVASNPYGRNILWPWLKKNWKKIIKKVGHGNPLINRILASLTLVGDSSMEKEIRQFFKKNPSPGTERTLEQTLERIRIHTRLVESMKTEFNF